MPTVSVTRLGRRPILLKWWTLIRLSRASWVRRGGTDVRKILFAVALSALFSVLARAEHVQTCNGSRNAVPDGLQIVCSATWQFSGTCTGRDLSGPVECNRSIEFRRCLYSTVG